MLVRFVQKFKRNKEFDAFRAAGVAFVHVPRAAGTSISRSIYPLWINHYPVVEHIETFPTDVLALPRFAVVRNPWDRAVSSWCFARAGGDRDGVTISDAQRYRVDEFATFERFVQKWLPRQQLEMADPIFRSQSYYLFDAQDELAVDHVGRFEKLHATERWLSDILGRNVTFPHLNATGHDTYRNYYTVDLTQRVAEIYAEDIDRFGYQF